MLKLKTRPTPQKPVLITGEQLAEMENIGRCDLINGEIRPKMPTKREHGQVSALIIGYLIIHNLQHKRGEVYSSETGVYTRREPDTVRGMDAAFISHERLKHAKKDSFLTVAPELVVEVLSRSNTKREIDEKLVEYFDIGVAVVWVVNPRRRQVKVYRSADKFDLLTTSDRLTCPDLLPEFDVAVKDIFTS